MHMDAETHRHTHSHADTHKDTQPNSTEFQKDKLTVCATNSPSALVGCTLTFLIKIILICLNAYVMLFPRKS